MAPSRRRHDTDSSSSSSDSEVGNRRRSKSTKTKSEVPSGDVNGSSARNPNSMVSSRDENDGRVDVGDGRVRNRDARDREEKREDEHRGRRRDREKSDRGENDRKRDEDREELRRGRRDRDERRHTEMKTEEKQDKVEMAARSRRREGSEEEPLRRRSDLEDRNRGKEEDIDELRRGRRDREERRRDENKTEEKLAARSKRREGSEEEPRRKIDREERGHRVKKGEDKSNEESEEEQQRMAKKREEKSDGREVKVRRREGSEEEIRRQRRNHEDKRYHSERREDKIRRMEESEEEGELPRNGRRDGEDQSHQAKKREEKMEESEEEGEMRRRDKRDDKHRGNRTKRRKESSSDGETEESEEEEETRKRRRDRDRSRRDKKREDKLENRDSKSRREASGEEEEEERRNRNDRNRDEYRFLDRDRQKDEETKNAEKQPVAVKQLDDAGVIRTGGIYIPPHRMAQMMRDVQDKSSDQYQRLSWDALRKSINGLVNKVNATNIKNIIPELLSENLIRGRGLFCRSCMKSQMASPGFTDVFAALVAVVNTKFPEVGKLLLKRIVLQLKRAYKRNDKPQLLAATKFVAHLVNQQVAHEIIALELLTVLLENPTDDSVEVAVGFVKECGALLQDFSSQGLHGIFERFRGILHEGEIDKRVQFLIEGLFAIRKAKFQGFPAVRPELDLVEQEDQFTHEISLEDEIDPETNLDIFKSNPQYLEDEKAYEDLKRSILGDESSSDEEGSDAASDDEDEEDSEEEDEEAMKIKDETETNLVNLRRTIYLTIMSSVDFEEAGHKLLKIKLEPGQEMELCIMLLECCSQERTYLRYYGLLGQRFCMINRVHQENFEKCFVQQYSMIHRLETNKLRNVAKFFAHLLGTNALPWHVLSYIRLTEEDTTSSSRIFIKIIFQELSEHLGIRLLNERLNDPTMQDSFESIFPKDNPKNTRFAINFFTSIGLGGITESLREYLKNMPRLIMQQQKPVPESDDESGSSDASSSGGSSSESGSSSDSESSSDESDRHRKRRRR